MKNYFFKQFTYELLIICLSMISILFTIAYSQEENIGKKELSLTAASSEGEAGGELLGPLANTVSTPQVSQFNGSLTTTIPLMMPPGRGAIQPKLALSYNSSSNAGIAGVGWDLNYECIIRKTTFGPPTYSSKDIFQYLGEDLFPMPDGTLRTKHESFKQFEIKIDPSGQKYWIMTEPNGTKKIFGQSEHARLINPDSTVEDPVFKWALEEAVDVYGNMAKFFYKYPRAQDDELMLSDVYYPLHNSMQNPFQVPHYHISLIYEKRFVEELPFYEHSNEEGKVINYQSGFAIAKERFKLSWVNVEFVDPTTSPPTSLARRYEFLYSYSSTTYRSLLTGIDLLGNGGSRLHHYTLKYNDTEPYVDVGKTWFKKPNNWSSDYIGSSDYTQYTGDFNGDGCQDLLLIKPAQNHKSEFWVALSKSDAFKLDPKPWYELQALTTSFDCRTTKIGDFDGNNKDDILIYSARLNSWWVLFSNGSSFTKKKVYSGGPQGEFFKNLQCGEVIGFTGEPPEWKAGDIVHVADFNGDGKADIMHYLRGQNIIFPGIGVKKGYRYLWTIILSNGNNFSDPKILIEGEAETGFYEVRNEDEIHLGDFDGDGKTDILHYAEHKEIKVGNVLYKGDERYWRVISFIDSPNGNQVRSWHDTQNGLINLYRIYRYAEVNDWRVGNATNRKLDVNKHLGDFILVGDLNGDGLHDVVHYLGNVKYNSLQVMFSNGRRFLGPEGWGAWSINPQEEPQILTGEVDGDGKMDILFYREGKYIPLHWTHIKSCGYSFWWPPPSQTSISPISNVKNWWEAQSVDQKDRYNKDKIIAGDFNGDGKTDILHYRAKEGDWFVYPTKEAGVDLLVEIVNPFWGKSEITYKSSSAYQNPDLPFIIPVVDRVRIQDGVKPEFKEAHNVGSDDMLIRYNYKDGKFDYNRREFLGFHIVESYTGLPSDSEVLWTETIFNQTESGKGLIEIQKKGSCQYDGTGEKLLTEIRNIYGKSEDSPLWTSAFDIEPPFFNPITKQWTYTYGYDNNQQSNIKTLVEFEYDDWGNITDERSWGNYDITGDEKSTLRQYLPNEEVWILNLLVQTTLFEGFDQNITEKNIIQFFYDDNTDWSSPPIKGDLTHVKRWTGIKFLESRSKYDAFGNVTDTWDAKNNLTHIDYDEKLHIFPLKITNPLMHTVEQEYDFIFGVPTKNVDPNGHETHIEYDDLGCKKRIWGPAQPIEETYEYFGFKDRIEASVPTIVVSNPIERGNIWWIIHVDGLGRVIQTREKTSQQAVGDFETRTSQSYNSQGKVSHVSLPQLDIYTGDYNLQPPAPVGHNALWLTYEYDVLGRLTKRQKPDGANTKYHYFLWKITVIDAEGKEKKFNYDAYQRLSEVNEYNTEYQLIGSYLMGIQKTYITRYSYNALDKITLITDDKGNETIYSYDNLGRKIYSSDINLGKWNFIYYDNDNVQFQTDAKGQTIEFKYDALNRIEKKEYPNGDVVKYRYDYYESSEILTPWSANAKGLLTRIDDNSGHTLFYYDEKGKTVEVHKFVDGKTFQTKWQYNNYGQLSSMTYPDNETIHYEYDEAGRLFSIPDYVKSIYYNANGQTKVMTYANNTIVEYDYYDATLMPKKYTTKNQNGDLFFVDYIWDNVGNLTQTSGYIGQKFNYDDLHRLVMASGWYGQIKYDYNSIGNILRKGADNYLYNDLAHIHAVTNDGSYEYIYDANGNMSEKIGSDQVTLISYNVDNLPITIEINGKVTSFTYDGVGNRVKKVVQSGSVGHGLLNEITYYIGEYILESDGSSTKYISICGQKVAVKSAKGTRYYHLDHLGSTQFQTDESENSSILYGYRPFGEVSVFPFNPVGKLQPYLPLPKDRYMYTGQELDESTNLCFYQSRYYDATLGRFFSPDVAFKLYDPQSLNAYSYSLNNPLKYTDPTGHLPVLAWVGIGLFAAGLTTYIVGEATGNEIVQTIGKFAMGSGLILTQAGLAISGVPMLHSFAFGTAGAIFGGTHGNPFNPENWRNFSLHGAIFGYMSGSVTGFILENMSLPFYTNLYSGWKETSGKIISWGGAVGSLFSKDPERDFYLGVGFGTISYSLFYFGNKIKNSSSKAASDVMEYFRKKYGAESGSQMGWALARPIIATGWSTGISMMIWGMGINTAKSALSGGIELINRLRKEEMLNESQINTRKIPLKGIIPDITF